MNILYICADRGIPIRGHKGAAIHVRALTDAFARAGHHVTILTPRPGAADGPALQADIREVPLPVRPSSTSAAVAEMQQLAAYNELLGHTALTELASRPYDFIYERYSLWSDVGARLSLATGLPLVLEVNAPLREEAARFRTLPNPVLAAYIEKCQFGQAAFLSVVSASLADYVVEQGARTTAVHVLPNAVDPALFHPGVDGCAVRQQYGLQNRQLIGFVGRPRPWHDLQTLLHAFARLHAEDGRYHLLLVGEMPPELADQLAELGIAGAVTMTGAVHHNEVPAHIAALDVAVSPHPALGDFYFSPLKLFEYLACGVPVVTAEIGQPAQIVQHGKIGHLYKPGNAKSLARRIRTLVRHPHHAHKVAWQGAEMVLQNHTWDGNARAVVEWISSPSDVPIAHEDTKKELSVFVPSWLSSSSAEAPNVWPRPVELPILDKRLRRWLYQATRPDLAGAALARLPLFAENDLELTAVADIAVLKYKPLRRCVLAYTLRACRRSDGRLVEHHVIGKVFKDRRGLRLYRLQAHLWNNGFGPLAADGIHVPRPLAYLPDLRMLVQERAPGATLNELAERGPIDRQVEQCGQALAKLHASPVPAVVARFGKSRYSGWGLTGYSLTDELKSLAHFTAELVERQPAHAGFIHSTADALGAWAAQLPTPPVVVPIHRDFYYSQMLFSDDRPNGNRLNGNHPNGGRLTLIDFDLLALGDPAIDVANFIAHLFFLGLDRLGDQNALAEEAERFLEAYGRFAPLDDSFQQRVAFHQAATYFRLLNVTADRPGLIHLFPALQQLTVASLRKIETGFLRKTRFLN